MTPTKETFTCGEVKTIDFTIERRKPFDGKVFVSAHVVNMMGVNVAQCDSRLVEHWIDSCSRHDGRFTFRTPWLKPGSYRLELFICSAGVIDRFDEAAVIEVLPLLPYLVAGNDEATAEGLVFSEFAYE